MKLIKRDSCVVTNNSDFEFLHKIKNFPVFMGCVNTPIEDDLVVDMSWSISQGSGLIHLDKLIPIDILYAKSHGSGDIGELWDNHHKAFASFLNRFDPSSVLEIGGGHGILSKEYLHFNKIPWTILEPNPSPVDGCEADYIRGFFDGNFSFSEPVNTVVHSHVFEHIYNQNEFMLHLSNFMEAGKWLIFTLPNMQRMLERKYTNCLNFEHTIFITEPYIEFLLAKHGFNLIEKEYFMEDHSIFYATKRDPSVSLVGLVNGLYDQNKQIYMDYVNYHEKLINDLNYKMSKTSRPLYLFGAHIFAQYLITAGLNTSHVVSLLDNDPNKQGKRLYGTSLMVESPKVLREVKSPVVILKAGFYNQEIKKDICENINQHVVFWE